LRLADAEDLHRIEIRTAIDRDTPIIPVPVGGAAMPRRDELPEDIRAFAQQQAIEITDSRWEYDAQRLSESVAELLEESRWREERQQREREEQERLRGSGS
jgi:hypothetical protein